jgi:hypothetical protein
MRIAIAVIEINRFVLRVGGQREEIIRRKMMQI